MSRHVKKRKLRKYDSHLLIDRLKKEGIVEEIKKLCEEQNHSYGMTYDWLKKYHNHVFNNLKVTKKAYWNRLKEFNIKIDNIAYNRQPNSWKLQYVASPEQIKKWARQGNKTMYENRKQQQNYFKKQGIDYWLKICKDPIQAKKERDFYIKSNSPFCEEFYVKHKGWTYEEANKKLTNDRVSAALASLKKTQKPKTEKILKTYFDEDNVLYSEQFSIKNEIGLDKRKKLVFDFYLPKQNLLIEVNGTYWHADKRYFDETDILNFPGGNQMLAKNIWSRDQNKINCAKKLGFKIVTIWEKELNEQNKNYIMEMIYGK